MPNKTTKASGQAATNINPPIYPSVNGTTPHRLTDYPFPQRSTDLRNSKRARAFSRADIPWRWNVLNSPQFLKQRSIRNIFRMWYVAERRKLPPIPSKTEKKGLEISTPKNKKRSSIEGQQKRLEADLTLGTLVSLPHWALFYIQMEPKFDRIRLWNVGLCFSFFFTCSSF